MGEIFAHDHDCAHGTSTGEALETHIRQIRSAIPLPMMHETDPNPMSPDIPIERVLASYEIREESSRAAQRAQLSPGDWRKARIVEGSREGIVS